MGTPAISKRLELIGVVALLVVLLVQAGLSIERISLTGDEVTHIPSGFTYWKTRDFRLNPEHPAARQARGSFAPAVSRSLDRAELARFRAGRV